ncbi:MAG: ferritin [Planctomycetes bacterium]|nr:ferritin [Planctomycetota bacterium]
MLSENMTKALNEQISFEIYSSYIYLQMAAWFDNKSLSGFANWMKVQAQEELAHSMIFYNYVNERGMMVEFDAIPKPKTEYVKPVDVFKSALAHEHIVTERINYLMGLAIEEKDYATKSRLDWFIDEQVEEESSAHEIIDKLELIGDHTQSLFMFDKEMAARIFNTPAPLVGK